MKKTILMTILTGMVYSQLDDSRDWVSLYPNSECNNDNWEVYYNSDGHDMRGCDLRDIEIESANLSGADLSGAKITNVLFNDTNLSDANFTGADLRTDEGYADIVTSFSRSILTGVNFTNALLQGVDFSDADLSGVNFTNSDLESPIEDLTMIRTIYPNLEGANLSDANFTSVNLEKITFENAIISGIDFSLAERIPLGWNINNEGISFPNGWGINENGVFTEMAYVEVQVCNNDNWQEYYNSDGHDMRGCDLRDFTIESANLSGADLSRANLSGADLTDVDFTGANLENTNLIEVNLTRANLTGARLTGARLVRANLTDANLEGADFTRATLHGTNLTGANLTGANLTGASLAQRQYDNTRGDRSANFTEANLAGVDFSTAFLYWVNFTRAILTGANFREANLTRARATNADLTDVDFTGANLAGVDFREANLTRANLTTTVLGVGFSRGNPMVYISTANFKGANLTDANLEGANLKDEDLSETNFTGANLTDVDLSNANLREANLTNANLTNANLTNANLTNANLRGANLGELISVMVRGENAHLPDGWSIVRDWGSITGLLTFDESESATTPAEENTIELDYDSSFNNIRTEIDRVFDERRNYSLFKKIDITGDAQIEWKELVRIIDADGIESISIDQFDNFILQFIKALDDDLFNNIRPEIDRVFDEKRNYSLFKKIDITGDAQIEWRELVRIIGEDGIESISIDQFDNFIIEFINGLIID